MSSLFLLGGIVSSRIFKHFCLILETGHDGLFE